MLLASERVRKVKKPSLTKRPNLVKVELAKLQVKSEHNTLLAP